MNDASPHSPLRLAVLISGGGTTLRNLIRRQQQGRLPVDIRLVISSSASAKGLQYAADEGIPSLVVRPRQCASAQEFSRAVFEPCRQQGVDLVAMGGFLQLLPIPQDFHLRVMNIHPALMPAFSGQGYYGIRVHQAVLAYGAKISGCTVHFVDDQYDHGPIILQRAVPVLDDDTAESLAARVFEQECEAYPEAIELFAAGRLRVEQRRVRILPPPGA